MLATFVTYTDERSDHWWRSIEIIEKGKPGKRTWEEEDILSGMEGAVDPIEAVRFGFGVTVSLGGYQMARIDVGTTKVHKPGDAEKEVAFKSAEHFVSIKLLESIEKMRKNPII